VTPNSDTATDYTILIFIAPFLLLIFLVIDARLASPTKKECVAKNITSIGNGFYKVECDYKETRK
jgi:hypothetical protein